MSEDALEIVSEIRRAQIRKRVKRYVFTYINTFKKLCESEFLVLLSKFSHLQRKW